MALSVSEETTQRTGESLDADRKEASDNVDRTLGGKEFQARAAAKGNARSPGVDCWVNGTTSVDVLADMSRRRASTLVDRLTFRHFKIYI